MTAFALPAAVLDAIFASEAAPEVEQHQAVELDDEGILELYARDQRARGLAPHTLRCYRTAFRAFVRALHGRGLTLRTAQRDDIAAWIATCGKVNRTRNWNATRLALLFRWMQEEGHRADLPTKGLRRAKVPRDLPRPIPPAGLYRALEAADPRVGLMLSLAAFAGLRRAEIAAVDRADILDDQTPPLLLVHGKGGKPRPVPIGPKVAAAFARYGLPEAGPIFPGRPKGTPISAHSVGELISNHLRACGVDCTTHQARHSYATRLYEVSGGDLLIVMQMLGHASVATTQIYTQWSPSKAADAIALL